MVYEELRRLVTYVGATGKLLRIQLRNPYTGAVLDLSDYTAAVLSAKDASGVYQISSATLTIEAGTSGWVNFYPAATEVDTAGEFFAQVKATHAVGPDYSEKLIIEVRTPIDSGA